MAIPDCQLAIITIHSQSLSIKLPFSIRQGEQWCERGVAVGLLWTMSWNVNTQVTLSAMVKKDLPNFLPHMTGTSFWSFIIVTCLFIISRLVDYKSRQIKLTSGPALCYICRLRLYLLMQWVILCPILVDTVKTLIFDPVCDILQLIRHIPTLS